jgi:hypothetical protein
MLGGIRRSWRSTQRRARRHPRRTCARHRRGSGTKLNRQSDGAYALYADFFVDFEEQADGARPHEIHLPSGDCTTEIFQ